MSERVSKLAKLVERAKGVDDGGLLVCCRPPLRLILGKPSPVTADDFLPRYSEIDESETALADGIYEVVEEDA